MFRLIHGSSGLRPSNRGYEAGTHKGCNPAPPGSAEVDGFSKSEQVPSALSDLSDTPVWRGPFLLPVLVITNTDIRDH